MIENTTELEDVIISNAVVGLGLGDGFGEISQYRYLGHQDHDDELDLVLLSEMGDCEDFRIRVGIKSIINEEVSRLDDYIGSDRVADREYWSHAAEMKTAFEDLKKHLDAAIKDIDEHSASCLAVK